MHNKVYHCVFSPLAEKDLDEIFEYISYELFAPMAALRLIDSIQAAVEDVCKLPFSRPLLKDRVLREKGYRLLVVKNFNLFYVVEERTVIIRRVMYGRRNYESLL